MQSNELHMPYMLSERSFAATLLLAVILHLLVLVAWHLSPKTEVRDIPIRIMNIRLGGEDEGDEVMQQAAAEPIGNAPQVEAIIEQISRETLLQKPKPVVKNDNSVKQYVREVNMPNIRKTQRVKASGARDAEMMSRYTQLISLWLYKFQTYPEKEHLQGIVGSTVVRIRVDRRGNVRYYALERTTGSEALDRAAIDMVRRANPVPAVPNDYPEGEVQEFLIPVRFK